MLLPLNLKTSKSVALSIIKIDQFYSIKPCTIVNGFGMDEIDSSFILTKAENENFFSPIAVFDFDAEFDETGEDAVCREIMEETGYVITPEVPKFVEVETSPKANKQNITLIYTALVPYKLLSQVQPTGGEDNEVEEIKWIDIRKLNNYKWAFNHNKIIERIILLKQYIQNDRHKHFS